MLGQGLALLLGVFKQRLGLRLFNCQSLGLCIGLGSLLGPLRHLCLNLLQALLCPLPSFHHETNFRLKSPDLGCRLVQLALGLVDLLARIVVGLTQGFYLAFGVP